jgi:hypothetical protein
MRDGTVPFVFPPGIAASRLIATKSGQAKAAWSSSQKVGHANGGIVPIPRAK